MFAEYHEQDKRFNTCKKCKFFKKKSQTCGTPIIGNKVTYRKKEYKLCGCFMGIKSRLRFATCPVGKWDSVYITKQEYQDLKEILELTVDKVTREQNNRLAELHRQYFKSNVQGSSCRKCVIKTINDLHTVIQQYEDKS